MAESYHALSCAVISQIGLELLKRFLQSRVFRADGCGSLRLVFEHADVDVVQVERMEHKSHH